MKTVQEINGELKVSAFKKYTRSDMANAKSFRVVRSNGEIRYQGLNEFFAFNNFSSNYTKPLLFSISPNSLETRLEMARIIKSLEKLREKLPNEFWIKTNICYNDFEEFKEIFDMSKLNDSSVSLVTGTNTNLNGLENSHINFANLTSKRMIEQVMLWLSEGEKVLVRQMQDTGIVTDGLREIGKANPDTSNLYVLSLYPAELKTSYNRLQK